MLFYGHIAEGWRSYMAVLGMPHLTYPALKQQPIVSLTQKFVTVTHYCECHLCCGKRPRDKGYGTCADDQAVARGAVAADWRCFAPPGAIVRFHLDTAVPSGRNTTPADLRAIYQQVFEPHLWDGVFVGCVRDTGGAFRGQPERCDIFFGGPYAGASSGSWHALAHQAGRPRVLLELCWPTPCPYHRDPAAAGGYARVHRGRRGPATTYAQLLLRAAGCPPGAIDGACGPKMTQAIKAFQSKNPACGAADGDCGPKTWPLLAQYEGRLPLGPHLFTASA